MTEGAAHQEGNTSSDNPPTTPQEQTCWEGRVLPANTGRSSVAAPNGAAGPAPGDAADFGDEWPPERTPSGLALWFWWTVATIAGWALYYACGGVIFNPNDPSPWSYVFMPLTGLFQWLLLRRHFARAGWWLLATIAGTTVTALIYIALVALPEATFGPPSSGLRLGLSALADGVALATAQWLVLRRTVHGAALWLPAAIAPFVLFAWLEFQRGLEAAQVLETLDRPGQIGQAAANGAFVGLLVGALTGAVLMRLVETSNE